MALFWWKSFLMKLLSVKALKCCLLVEAIEAKYFMGKHKNETINNWAIVFLLVGVSTLDNRKISLTVSSLDAEEEVVVYMTLNNTRYPLGLLPGHVIRFRNLERRVSQHGSVYCQYVVVSTLEILGAGTQPLFR